MDQNGKSWFFRVESTPTGPEDDGLRLFGTGEFAPSLNQADIAAAARDRARVTLRFRAHGPLTVRVWPQSVTPSYHYLDPAPAAAAAFSYPALPEE